MCGREREGACGSDALEAKWNSLALHVLKWSEKTPNCNMVVVKMRIKSKREVLVCSHQASND